MTRALNRLLSARSGVSIAALSFLLVAALGSLDYLTGYELSFSIFYLIPVAIGSWYGGRRLAIAICAVSACTWFVVDYSSGHEYSLALIPLWNAVVRLGFFLIVAYLLQELRANLELQASLAQRDGLTGLMNAATFRHRCRGMFQLAHRHGHALALGYLDLDEFKTVNDRQGHGAGDKVLQAVASALACRLRESDLVARMGGDEFVMLLPETDAAGARVFFAEVHEILRNLAVDNGWPIGFSLGVVVLRSIPGNPEHAIKYADDLMYRVKNAGKGDLLVEEYTGDWGSTRIPA